VLRETLRAHAKCCAARARPKDRELLGPQDLPTAEGGEEVRYGRG
jgi:hypothetical protein